MVSRKTRKRKGVTMLELLGVLAVVAVISSISVGGYVKAQNKSRLSNAEQALRAYADAFVTLYTMNPTIMHDREKNWGTDGSAYTSEAAYKRVAATLNSYVETPLELYWDVSEGAYVSNGKDPWGGRYVLREYPESPAGDSHYNPVSADATEMCFSIWATGISDVLTTDAPIDEDCVGVGLLYSGGNVTVTYHGVADQEGYTDWTVPANKLT